MPTPNSRPIVAIHVAQSLDGRLSTLGARALLSSPEGLRLAHRARASSDAVLVGSSTVRTDDPRLTVRECEGAQPRRIVLASTLDLPTTARLFAPGPGLLVVGVEGRAPRENVRRLTAAGAEVRLVRARPDGLVSLPEALAAIRAWGVERLLVEGGARVLTSFLRDRLVDEATIEVAPCLLGAPGVVTVGEIGVESAESALRLVDVRLEMAGSSMIVRGRFAK